MHFRTSLLLGTFGFGLGFIAFIHTVHSLYFFLSHSCGLITGELLSHTCEGFSGMDDNEANDTVSKVKFLIKLVFSKNTFLPILLRKMAYLSLFERKVLHGIFYFIKTIS